MISVTTARWHSQVAVCKSTLLNTDNHIHNVPLTFLCFCFLIIKHPISSYCRNNYVSQLSEMLWDVINILPQDIKIAINN